MSSSYLIDGTKKCPYESPENKLRTSNRAVVLTPISRELDSDHLEGSIRFSSPTKESNFSSLDTSPCDSSKRPSTPFHPKSSPPTSHYTLCEQMIPTKGSPKASRISIVKMSKARQAYLAVEPTDDYDNRLRGGATIVAKLPYSRCIDATNKRRQHIRKADTAKFSSDVASISSMSSTPRPQLLSLGSTRVRATSSSGPSSSDKGCCPYHIRVRKRNALVDSHVGSDAEVMVTAPRCRCSEKIVPARALSAQSSTAMSNKPPASTRLCTQPKRALSIEDAIIQLSKRSASPPSEFTGSSSSSSKEKKLLHRTLSTNRITDELRSKLGLTPPHKKGTVFKPSQALTSYKTSFERIMDGHAMGTQTLPSLPPTRCYSDSQVDLMARNMLKCNRCNHHCAAEQGVFSCDTCMEVQRVKNAFVLEIFADQCPSGENEQERTTCYGVRVGAGLLPVIVIGNMENLEKKKANQLLKARIQKDELYHHAKAQGLQILGPDPESDESTGLDSKDDYPDQGQVDLKDKRDTQFELEDYKDDESANNEYKKRSFKTAEDISRREKLETRASKFRALKNEQNRLQLRIQKVEDRMRRLEEIFRNRMFAPYYKFGVKRLNNK
uniref:Uncharacterized protein n=1 Tax=Strigamia maritima TaxID=126957 RepID=T1IHZ2_STRMM